MQEQNFSFKTCPCPMLSKDVFVSGVYPDYQRCLTCGRIRIPADQVSELPQLYIDLLVEESPEVYWIPNFYQDHNMMIFVDGTNCEDAEWVYLPLEESEDLNEPSTPNWKKAIRYPFYDYLRLFNDIKNIVENGNK